MSNPIIVQGHAALAEASKEHPKAFIIFYSDAENDKVSWCPDCVKGMFTIISILELYALWPLSRINLL